MEAENSQDKDKNVRVKTEEDNKFNNVQCPHSRALDMNMERYH